MSSHTSFILPHSILIYNMSAGTLYTFSGSGNSYKIRLLEAFLGLDLKHEEIDFLVTGHPFILLSSSRINALLSRRAINNTLPSS